MNTLKKIILFIFIAVVFVTCKKAVLPPSTTEGSPVFSFNGTIGGTPINMQAGVNNYYMYSSYRQNDTTGVYSFTGTLQNTASSNTSIQIIINDDKVSTLNASSDVNNSVIPATYYFNIPGGNPINYSVTFTPIVYVGNPTSFQYMFGDGYTSSSNSDSAVTHIYTKLQNYVTSLTMYSVPCGSVTTVNPINLTKQATTSLTIDSIHFKLDATYKVSLTGYITGGAPPYTYVWSYGNGSTSTPAISSGTSDSVINYIYSAPARTYTVTLGVLDSKKDTALYAYTLTDTASTACRMDYFTSTPAPAPNPNALSNVTVNYTNGSGNVYTSKNPSQPNNNTFQITSVSDYQNNLNNNPTKMLKVNFNCMLYNTTLHDSLQASNCTAIIAVAHP